MCARVERRLGGGGGGGSACGGGSGPSGAAAERTPAATGEVQTGLRAPRSRRGPGTGDPRGVPSPTELAGRKSALPGAAAAALPRLVADGARLRTAAGASLSSREPRKPPAQWAQKCLLPLPRVRSVAEQSCGRVPIAEPGAVATRQGRRALAAALTRQLRHRLAP